MVAFVVIGCCMLATVGSLAWLVYSADRSGMEGIMYVLLKDE